MTFHYVFGEQFIGFLFKSDTWNCKCEDIQVVIFFKEKLEQKRSKHVGIKNKQLI